MNAQQLDAFGDATIEVLKKAIDPLKADIATLRQRIAELEAAPRGLAYAGTWQRAAEYRRHQGVTHKSAIWVCVVDATRHEPGVSGDWQLAQKDTR